ncbi:hypothetical protein MMC25_001074 [Agyrium rufum]|nr:hypothetical protein [Agyrium rufum]
MSELARAIQEATTPAPIVVPASGLFEGNDGNWSTFNVSIGSPPQIVRLLPSTTIQEIFAISSSQCAISSPKNCTSLRGGLFNEANSTTWQMLAALGFAFEGTLYGNGDSVTGDFGLDEIGIEGTTSKSQYIGSINGTSNIFGLGNIGLLDQTLGTGVPNTPPQASFISALKNDGSIPTKGYGYTAGAAYQNTPGSLTLGGYDAGRFEWNDVTFNSISSDGQLTVGLQKIQYLDSTLSTPSQILSGGVEALIDTGIPDLWLPYDTCGLIQHAFNLTFDSPHLRYVITEEQRQTNIRNNATATFFLGVTDDSGSPSVPITISYQAFDQVLSPPILATATRYFPLRQSKSNDEIRLGRVFFQEAYLAVDLDSANFTIAQATLPPGPQHILAFTAYNSTATGSPSPSGTGTGSSPTATAVTVTHSSGGLAGGAIAGIVIGVIAIFAIIGGFIIWKRRTKRERRAELHDEDMKFDEGNETKGFFGGPHSRSGGLDGAKQPMPITNVAEVHGEPIGHARALSDPPLPAELDEGAPRRELESLEPVGSPASHGSSILAQWPPTHMETPSELPSPTSELPSPSFEKLSLSHQPMSPSSLSLGRSGAASIADGKGSPHLPSMSAFTSPNMRPAPTRMASNDSDGQLTQDFFLSPTSPINESNSPLMANQEHSDKS